MKNNGAWLCSSISALESEVVSGPNFGLLSISDVMVFASTEIMRLHNVNATDAALLALLLDYTQVLPSGRSGCVVVTADRRLLRAAAAEGLKTLAPEKLAPAGVPAFLAGL